MAIYGTTGTETTQYGTLSWSGSDTTSWGWNSPTVGGWWATPVREAVLRPANLLERARAALAATRARLLGPVVLAFEWSEVVAVPGVRARAMVPNPRDSGRRPLRGFGRRGRV